MDNVHCSEHESYLCSCPHNGKNSRNCNHGEDIGFIVQVGLKDHQATFCGDIAEDRHTSHLGTLDKPHWVIPGP